MYPNFGKVGVIFGGLSSERDISLKSGEAIFAALIKEGLDVREINLTTENPEEVEQIIRDAAVDVVFIAMHGRFGEDGKLQAILENMHIDYVGSDSLASALAMNKIAARKVFEENNIPVPIYTVLNRHYDFKKEDLSFPLVVKPQSQGSSLGITFVKSADEIDQALKLAFRYGDNIIIEEYIEGKELTVGILGNRALEPIEILPKNQFFDFQAKYNKGLTEYILPASIDADLRSKIQYISLKAHRALGCRHFSRVDLLLDQDNNPFILELNTIPGFMSTSLLPKAALYEGITFSQLCIKLLTLAVEDSVPTLNR
ncbi:MAG: D-alanine--D-alanine ligase [Candidatus Omnitrophica bacterium]|nr:D-alanine--D-alanine ligase [Candidatus Omnitrophota bacterium]